MTPVEYRAPAAHELEAFATVLDASFGIRPSPIARERFFRSVPDAELLAAFDGDELVGSLAVYHVEQTLPGLVLAPSAAITNVGVLPTHRRRGIMRGLMDATLRDLCARGEMFALLFASEGGLYGRFGFGPATFGAQYAIDRHDGTLDLGDLPSDLGSVRMVSAEEAASAFPAVSDAARRLRPGEIDRHETWWEELFDLSELPAATARFFACYEHDGVIDGFVVYDVRGGFGKAEMREAEIVELASVSSAANLALFRFVLGVDLTTRVLSGPRPIDEPLRFALCDPRGLRTLGVFDRSWLRVLDVEAALCARRYVRPGEIVLSIHDATLPANARTLTLTVGKDGVASVRTATRSPDLTFGIAALASVYLGGVRFSRLARAGRVHEATDGAIEAADLLFFSDPEPFCSVDF